MFSKDINDMRKHLLHTVKLKGESSLQQPDPDSIQQTHVRAQDVHRAGAHGAAVNTGSSLDRRTTLLVPDVVFKFSTKFAFVWNPKKPPALFKQSSND